jgi:hypothetical protein
MSADMLQLVSVVAAPIIGPLFALLLVFFLIVSIKHGLTHKD